MPVQRRLERVRVQEWQVRQSMAGRQAGLAIVTLVEARALRREQAIPAVIACTPRGESFAREAALETLRDCPIPLLAAVVRHEYDRLMSADL